MTPMLGIAMKISKCSLVTCSFQKKDIPEKRNLQCMVIPRLGFFLNDGQSWKTLMVLDVGLHGSVETTFCKVVVVDIKCLFMLGC